MYSLMTEFRDGDNVVTTLLEHNSNFVPCRLSFYLYNTRDEVDRAAEAVARIAGARCAAREMVPTPAEARRDRHAFGQLE
jgi:selenocysteine lyase/cysteine desulfurase